MDALRQRSKVASAFAVRITLIYRDVSAGMVNGEMVLPSVTSTMPTADVADALLMAVSVPAELREYNVAETVDVASLCLLMNTAHDPMMSPLRVVNG